MTRDSRALFNGIVTPSGTPVRYSPKHNMRPLPLSHPNSRWSSSLHAGHPMSYPKPDPGGTLTPRPAAERGSVRSPVPCSSSGCYTMEERHTGWLTALLHHAGGPLQNARALRVANPRGTAPSGPAAVLAVCISAPFSHGAGVFVPWPCKGSLCCVCSLPDIPPRIPAAPGRGLSYCCIAACS